jgi:hypothetical protein
MEKVNKLYILVEDGVSFYEILPYWLKVLAPGYSRARTVDEMGDRSYVLFGAGGYPKILGTSKGCQDKNILGEAIETVIEKGIDMLVVCLDGDDEGVAGRKRAVAKKIDGYPAKLRNGVKVLVQNKCVETWLLGNGAMYPRKASGVFAPFAAHYNVRERNPEYMEKPETYTDTASVYHAYYLKRMLKENNIKYSKSKPPHEIKKEGYLNAIRKRAENTGHLGSFGYFVDFFNGLQKHNCGL